MQEHCPIKIKIPRNHFPPPPPLEIDQEVQIKIKHEVTAEEPFLVKIGKVKEINSNFIEVKIFKSKRRLFYLMQKEFEKSGWQFEFPHQHPYTSIFV